MRVFGVGEVGGYIQQIMQADEILTDVWVTGEVTSFTKARDTDPGNEDYLRLVLDTFRDGRSGYVFSVNPTGARFDGLVVRQGESTDATWDAIWEAATARTRRKSSARTSAAPRSPRPRAWRVSPTIRRAKRVVRWGVPTAARS